MESSVSPTPTPKVGRIRKGWELTKSSWRVLRLDKELANLPLLSFFVSLLALIPFAVIGIINSSPGVGANADQHLDLPGWASALMLLGIYFVTTLVANFFEGAIIYGATERFRGGDPSVSSSLSGASRKFAPLALFSLMMASVGLILRSLEERLPFAGRLTAYLFGAAWSLANIFAVPVIVLSEENVNPMDATKRSVGIIKKVWGESIVINLGIALIGTLSLFAYMALCTVVGIALSVASVPVGLGITAVLIAVFGFFAGVLVFSALGSIAKAALYHYTVTGMAPEAFNTQMLRAAMTPKKARKIFG